MFNRLKSRLPGNGNFPPIKLAWKFALFTGLLVLFVTVAITFPIYWQTRQTLEIQLAEQLQQNARIIVGQLDPALVKSIVDYPEVSSLKAPLIRQFDRQIELFAAQTIYLVDQSGVILLVAGNETSALKSSMLHKTEIKHAATEQIVTTPLFSDRSGHYYKSVFAAIPLHNDKSVILGLDASAGFLESTARLRNQILSLTAVILIISIGLVLLLARTLTGPLDRLTQYALGIGQGRNELPALRPRRDEIGFLGNTMQKMQADILQREKENKQFLASVAHEIRNPLGGMKINAELLLESVGNSPTIVNFATAIGREVDRLAQIVDSFLTYARPIEANLVICDLRELIDNIITELKRDFPDGDINVIGQAPARVNPGKIRHCFFNLIKNGLEAASEQSQVAVSLNTENGRTVIRFLNSGAPIPPEIQSQIFEAFFSTKPDGVGLGLAISKSLVGQHGGQIYLDHSDARGTEFVIILPE